MYFYLRDKLTLVNVPCFLEVGNLWGRIQMLPLRGCLFAVVAAACLAAPTAVFAALISVGTGLGPGTGVLDTTTGNVWIKFSAQQPNKTAGDLPLILAQPGYAGFQLATSAQITMLVSNELAALGGPKVNTFDALITAFGPSFVRDDSGTGSMLSFGAVDTAIGPIVTVTPIDSN